MRNFIGNQGTLTIGMYGSTIWTFNPFCLLSNLLNRSRTANLMQSQKVCHCHNRMMPKHSRPWITHYFTNLFTFLLVVTMDSTPRTKRFAHPFRTCVDPLAGVFDELTTIITWYRCMAYSFAVHSYHRSDDLFLFLQLCHIPCSIAYRSVWLKSLQYMDNTIFFQTIINVDNQTEPVLYGNISSAKSNNHERCLVRVILLTIYWWWNENLKFWLNKYRHGVLSPSYSSSGRNNR